MKVYRFALTAMMIALTCGVSFAQDNLNLFNIQSGGQPTRIPASTTVQEAPAPHFTGTLDVPAPPVVGDAGPAPAANEIDLFTTADLTQSSVMSTGSGLQKLPPVQKGVTQKGSVLQKGVAQKGILQKGIAQKGIAQKGIAQKGIAQKGIVQHQSAILNDCCLTGGCCGSWVADIEATFFRLHRADGYNSDNVYGFELSPRVTVGRIGADGLGVRARWWDYDHSNNDGAAAHSIDTYNIDLELFQEIDLSCNTSVEVSAGTRYNDFEYIDGNNANQRDTFSAWGGMLGIQANRAMCRGVLYTRLREVILMSDWGDNGTERFDVTRSVTEIAAGFETTRCLANGAVMTLNAGVEWQQWENYIEGPANEEPVDIGFGGFVLGVGFDF